MIIIGTMDGDWIDAADGVTASADTIYGDGGEDFLFGLGGDDWLIGGTGADYLAGGEGNDTAWYDDSNAGVRVDLRTGTGTGGTAEGDVLVDVENVAGSLYNDVLIGNDRDNVLDGLSGRDTLGGGGGADTLNGDNGDDWLQGGTGGDTLNGGHGIDTADYWGSARGVTVLLSGTGYANGGDATGDRLSGIENLNGSSHADTLYGDDNGNVIRGNPGEDGIKGYGGADTLYGGDDSDVMHGMDGTDTLYGENGDDTLYGGNQNDTLDGGAHRDVLIGGSGADILIGGTGGDTFRFTALSDAPLGGIGLTDEVRDFSAAQFDKIDLSAIDAIAGGTDDPFTPIGAGPDVRFHGVAGELRFTGVFLEGDVNGDGNADFQIKVDGVASLRAGIDIIM